MYWTSLRGSVDDEVNLSDRVRTVPARSTVTRAASLRIVESFFHVVDKYSGIDASVTFCRVLFDDEILRRAEGAETVPKASLRRAFSRRQTRLRVRAGLRGYWPDR